MVAPVNACIAMARSFALSAWAGRPKEFMVARRAEFVPAGRPLS
jgi:hypothetical protein